MKLNFKKFFCTIRLKSYIPISYAIISSMFFAPYVSNYNPIILEDQQVIPTNANETKCTKLPLYDIYQSLLNEVDGSEIYFTENINDFDNENPWNENIKIDSLPVFINKYKPSENIEDINVNKMKNQILKIGKSFGVNVNQNKILKTIINENSEEMVCEIDKNINDNCVKVFYETDKIRINVNSDLSASVQFLEPFNLPNGYGYGIYPTYEQLKNTGNYIKNNLNNLLMMENPVVDICKKGYDTYKNQIFSLEFYDKGQDLKNSIINYGLNRVRIYCNDSAITYIRFNSFDLTDKLGDYPIISAKKARETALKGNLYNPFLNNPNSEKDIIKTELTYLEHHNQEVLMPFYKIYVKSQNKNSAYSKELGLEECSICYIPAIDENYLIYSY